MWSAVGSFLTSFAWNFVSWWLNRQRIIDAERNRALLEAKGKIEVALGWAKDHPVIINNNDPFADFLQSDKPVTESKDNDPGPPEATGLDKDRQG